jgi:hypothetical protein
MAFIFKLNDFLPGSRQSVEQVESIVPKLHSAAHEEVRQLNRELDATSTSLQGMKEKVHSIFKLDFLPRSRQLMEQVESITQKLHSPSYEGFHQLSRELDETSMSLQRMKRKVQSVLGRSDFFNKIEEKIIDLYGEIDKALFNREISQIQEKASLLQVTMIGGKVSVEEIEDLKALIEHFRKNHRPLASDQRVIAHAQQILEQAQKPVNHFEWLAQQQAQLVEEKELNPAGFEDILDIATSFYYGKLPEAKKHFNQLPQEHKQLIEKHLSYLNATLFKNELETIQALFATVYQLVGNGLLYPTANQIEEFFIDLKKETTAHPR